MKYLTIKEYNNIVLSNINYNTTNYSACSSTG